MGGDDCPGTYRVALAPEAPAAARLTAAKMIRNPAKPIR